MTLRSIILMSTEAETPWIRNVTNDTDQTSFGRVGGIHVYHGRTYLGLMVPPKYVSFIDVRDIKVEVGIDSDKLTVSLGAEA